MHFLFRLCAFVLPRHKTAQRRHLLAACHHHLTFADHVHEFNASKNIFGCFKRLGSQRGFGDSFDGTMILFDDIVEAFDLSHHDFNALSIFDDLVNGRLV